MLSPSDKDLRLKHIYSELNRKFEEEETQRKASTNKLPYISLYGFPIDTASLSLIDKPSAEAAGCVVFFKEGRNLKLGILEKNSQVERLIKSLKNQSYFVEVFVISQSSFEHALDSYKKVVSAVKHEDELKLSSADWKGKVHKLSDALGELKQASASKMVSIIFGLALGVDSSDVHLEPEDSAAKIRFRIDGVLQDVGMLPIEAHHQLVSRIKVLSRMKLNVTQTPQDGSFGFKYDQNQVDIRASVLPTTYGESLVLRILRQDKDTLQFGELGITGFAFKQLVRELEKPNGMILTTGPTGSGKTTTLYAILNRLNEPGVKIITLEDPVEYKLPGLTQTPIDSRAGMTFAAALRSILRQDPDVIMVGEMRDLETAETAAQAALTGHIVLSTLHTNDAVSALPRLIDLGVKPFVLAPAINAVIAQRLVRKLCKHCKTEYKPDPRLTDRASLILSSLPVVANIKVPTELKFYHSPGCKECAHLGYKGQVGLFEVFVITEEIERMIQKLEITSEMKRQALKDGMITMAQDGVLKALSGVTDLEEVFRVTEE